MPEVLLERPEAGIAVVRLNRPEQLNALNNAVRTLLTEHFTALSGDASVRVIVLTGDGKNFAAGADLKEMADRSTVEWLLRRSHLMYRALQSCPQPIIAAVDGYALGGG